MAKRLKFQIPIGDWSHDGHGLCEYFMASANAESIEDVREAYFKAKKVVPRDCQPELICHDYEEHTLDKEQCGKLKKAGAPLPEDADEEDGADYVGPEYMAELVVWFLNQGNPELKCKLEDKDELTLTFYGHDKFKRHIGHIGYGVFLT